jgi:hypothetical protein
MGAWRPKAPATKQGPWVWWSGEMRMGCGPRGVGKRLGAFGRQPPIHIRPPTKLGSYHGHPARLLINGVDPVPGKGFYYPDWMPG